MRRLPIYQRLVGSPLYPALAWPRDELLILRNLLLGSPGDRRTHAFCPGTPKSGTHSIVSMVGRSLRAAHEPHAMMLINALKGAAGPASPPTEVAPLLERRDSILALELESSHLLGPFVSTLVSLFREARFVLPIRDCFSWLDSMVNQQLCKRDEVEDRKWHFVWNLYFQPHLYRHPPEEQVLQQAGLHALDGYFTYWSTLNQHVLDTVPAHRLFVIRTDQIGSRAAELAAFLGIPPTSVDPERSHTYRRSSDNRLLDSLDQEYLASRCELHCRDLMVRFYPEVLQARLARSTGACSSSGFDRPSRG